MRLSCQIIDLFWSQIAVWEDVFGEGCGCKTFLFLLGQLIQAAFLFFYFFLFFVWFLLTSERTFGNELHESF